MTYGWVRKEGIFGKNATLEHQCNPFPRKWRFGLGHVGRLMEMRAELNRQSIQNSMLTNGMYMPLASWSTIEELYSAVCTNICLLYRSMPNKPSLFPLLSKIVLSNPSQNAVTGLVNQHRPHFFMAVCSHLGSLLNYSSSQVSCRTPLVYFPIIFSPVKSIDRSYNCDWEDD